MSSQAGSPSPRSPRRPPSRSRLRSAQCAPGHRPPEALARPRSAAGVRVDSTQSACLDRVASAQAAKRPSSSAPPSSTTTRTGHARGGAEEVASAESRSRGRPSESPKALSRSESPCCHRHPQGRLLPGHGRACGSRGMCLKDTPVEPLGPFRHIRRLKRPGRDHDLICGNEPVVELKAKRPLRLAQSLDLAVQLDGKLERLGVLLQIRDHLIPVGIARRGRPGTAFLAGSYSGVR